MLECIVIIYDLTVYPFSVFICKKCYNVLTSTVNHVKYVETILCLRITRIYSPK